MPNEKLIPDDFNDGTKINVSTNEYLKVNGPEVHNLNQLSPETQQKIRSALAKLQNNPALSMFLGGKAGIAEIMQQLNLDTSKTIIDQSAEKNTDQLLNQGNQTADLNKAQQMQVNSNQPYSRSSVYNSSFNPAVKTDSWRVIILLIALAAVGYYLLSTYFLRAH
jgi:hypothetical protein